MGLLKLRSGRAIDILMSLGLDFYEVKDKIEQRLEGKRYKSDKVESLDFTLAANSVLKRVSDEAWDLGDDELDSEHVMLAILRNQAGFVTKLFKTMNIDYDIFKEAVLKRRCGCNPNLMTRGMIRRTETMNLPCIILIVREVLFLPNPILPYWIISGMTSRKPQKRGFGPDRGRDREIERLAQILSRRKKNNPVLIGDRGWVNRLLPRGLLCVSFRRRYHGFCLTSE